jgi:hypothetical protein
LWGPNQQAKINTLLGPCGVLAATDALISHNLTAAIDGRLDQWMT